MAGVLKHPHEIKLYQDLPAAPVTPAPWDIQGEAYLILAKFPLDYIKSHGFFTPWHLEKISDGLAVVFLARFNQTNVGPYYEFAISPARLLLNQRKLFSITKIYVDSAESAVSGRKNWAIPKEMAEFEWIETGKRTEKIIAKKNGRVFAEMEFKCYPIPIPFHSRFVSSAWRTNLQPADHEIYLMDVTIQATLKPAHLIQGDFDPHYFCDLKQSKVLGVFKAEKFKAHYPLPQIFPK